MRMVSPDGPVYQAGTLSGNPIATAAGLATLRILEADTDIYMRLQENTAMLADAVRHAAGNRVHVNQIGSLMSIFFTGEDVTDYDSATTADTKAYADYFGLCLIMEFMWHRHSLNPCLCPMRIPMQIYKRPSM